MTKKCYFCGEENPDTTVVCPWCGRRDPTSIKSSPKTGGRTRTTDQTGSSARTATSWTHQKIRTATTSKGIHLARRWVIGLALFAVVLAGYSTVRYFVDRSNFNRGHQAFQSTDCAVAIEHFDRIINGWRLADIGGYLAAAQREKTECLPFQAAIVKQQDGDFSGALAAYTDFIGEHGESVLIEAASDHVASLFEHTTTSALASPESCGRIDALLEHDLIPQRETFLPPFYFACGEVYESEDNEQDSFAMYKAILTSYPTHPAAEEAEQALLANPIACGEADSLEADIAIADRADFMPSLYFACGEVYENENNEQDAFAMYEAILTRYPTHPLAEEAEQALLANPVACSEAESLQADRAVAERENFMLSLYLACGEMYHNSKDFTHAVRMYEAILTRYSTHPLAEEAEQALLANPVACRETESLQANHAIADRGDFMPTLYLTCGEMFEGSQDFTLAIRMYEAFQQYYPDHYLSSDVEAAMARAMVAAGRESNAGEIAPPGFTGRTSSGSTMVIIQNDSPERLRIVFSGPEARIEELAACSSCRTYFGVGPMFCPEQGPIGRYTLAPGEYDVLVESISDRGVTPFTGDWTLSSGNEYSSCFFIVTTFSP